MLRLSDRPFIAKGTRQYIYEHPNDPDLLVKVPQPGTFDSQGHLPETGWMRRRLKRSTMYNGFLREFREYLELQARTQAIGVTLPICPVHGTTPTDLGLGLIYERISEPDGSLSPNLAELIETGRFENKHFDLLHNLFDSLIENHVLVSNKNLSNIVFQTREADQGSFIWIDNFGSKQAIPLRKWFKWENARNLNRLRKQVIVKTELALARRTRRN